MVGCEIEPIDLKRNCTGLEKCVAKYAIQIEWLQTIPAKSDSLALVIDVETKRQITFLQN